MGCDKEADDSGKVTASHSTFQQTVFKFRCAHEIPEFHDGRLVVCAVASCSLGMTFATSQKELTPRDTCEYFSTEFGIESHVMFHAEMQAFWALCGDVGLENLRGERVSIAVDLEPCKGCRNALEFAAFYLSATVEVFGPENSYVLGEE